MNRKIEQTPQIVQNGKQKLISFDFVPLAVATDKQLKRRLVVDKNELKTALRSLIWRNKFKANFVVKFNETVLEAEL